MDARAFARRTRRGVVRREVREAHGGEETFRRRGAPVAKEALRDEKATYVVPDANVVLHQLDVLEHRDVTCAQLDRLVICRAAAEEFGFHVPPGNLTGMHGNRYGCTWLGACLKCHLWSGRARQASPVARLL